MRFGSVVFKITDRERFHEAFMTTSRIWMMRNTARSVLVPQRTLILRAIWNANTNRFSLSRHYCKDYRKLFILFILLEKSTTCSHVIIFRFFLHSEYSELCWWYWCIKWSANTKSQHSTSVNWIDNSIIPKPTN